MLLGKPWIQRLSEGRVWDKVSGRDQFYREQEEADIPHVLSSPNKSGIKST